MNNILDFTGRAVSPLTAAGTIPGAQGTERPTLPCRVFPKRRQAAAHHILWLWALFLALCPPARAQITNAIVTITAAPTNGASISINGIARTWTNSVTTIAGQIPLTTIYAVTFTNTAGAGATITINSSNVWTFANPVTTNTQALVGTNSANSATNFLAAYLANPTPFTTAAWAAGTSNKVLLYSYYGVPLTVSDSAGFASIATTSDLGVAATNLLEAYLLYLTPTTMNAFQGPASNQVQFQPFPGYSMTVTFPANGWASVAYTAYTPTNFVPVVVPDSGALVTTLSTWQRVNEESGLAALLSDNQATNTVTKSSPLWAQFATVTNYHHSPFTNGTAGITLTTNIYITNTFGAKAHVRFAAAPAGAAESQLLLYCISTNPAYVSPAQYLTLAGDINLTNTFDFDLGAWDYFSLSNHFAPSTIVTNEALW